MLVDPDPAETREWLDALDSVLEFEGTDRAEQLLDSLLAEIRFSAPNRHHFAYDLARFGLDNPGEVFHADDRPYGLIETCVRRDDAPEEGPAFDPGQGW